MKIKKYRKCGENDDLELKECIIATSSIYLGDIKNLAIQPCILMIAAKENPISGFEKYEINLKICESSHIFNYREIVYKPRKDQFLGILHEILNWMNDVEDGVSFKYDVWNSVDFPPQLDCERDEWMCWDFKCWKVVDENKKEFLFDYKKKSKIS